MDTNEASSSSRDGLNQHRMPQLQGLILCIAIVAVIVLSVLLAGQLGHFGYRAPNSYTDIARQPANSYQYTLAFAALAGILGSLLRSAGYLLGYRHLNPRETRQWRIETLVGPLLGAIAGMGAYLLVQTVLVASPDAINYSGQYILSTVCGGLAIGSVGRVIERGVLRGGLSRSGILGAQISTSVPVLDRIERSIEQRIAETTLYNYDGILHVRVLAVGPQQFVIQLYFDTIEREAEFDPESEYSETRRQESRLSVVGGTDAVYIPFTVTIVSDEWKAIPTEVPILVPKSGRSELREIFVDAYERQLSDLKRGFLTAVPLEISQGSQSIQAMPIVLNRL